MDANSIVSNLSTIIDKISAKIGVVNDRVYQVFLKQTQVDLVWNGIIAIIAIITFIAMAILIVQFLTNKSDDYESKVFISSMIAFFAFVIIMATVRNIVQINYNPDYFIYKHYLLPLIQK